MCCMTLISFAFRHRPVSIFWTGRVLCLISAQPCCRELFTTFPFLIHNHKLVVGPLVQSMEKIIALVKFKLYRIIGLFFVN